MTENILSDIDIEFPDGFMESLMVPLYWRVLIMPKPPKKETSGGIIVPEDAQEAEKYQCYIGKLLAAGPVAFRDKRLTGHDNDYFGERQLILPKLGDWLVYGRYAGQRLNHMGVDLLLLNDNEVLGIADPKTLRVYV